MKNVVKRNNKIKVFIFLFQTIYIVFYSSFIYSLNVVDSISTITKYAQKCSRILGDSIPDFDCSDGMSIPIYSQDGNVLDENEIDDECKNPALIPGIENPCATGSKLNILKKNNSNVIMVFLCRKHFHRPGINLFDDISIIQHNTKTGATCWYQSEIYVEKDINIHSKILSPSNSEVVNESSTIKWNASEIDNKSICINCHTSDPFVGTPYLSKLLKKKLEEYNYSHSFSYYSPANNEKWNNLKQVKFKQPSPAERCLKCHRIAINPGLDGGFGDCEKFLNDSLGLDNPTSQYSNLHVNWMPPESDKMSPNELKKAIADLKSCCKNADGNLCAIIPIPGENKLKIKQTD